METLGTVRPNKKAGNMSPDFKKNRKNSNSEKKNFSGKNIRKSKPQKKGFTIPKFLQPEFIITASGMLAVAESGGVKDKSLEGLLTGSSFIVTSRDGSKKKPIYIFKKKDFENGVSHKKSMLFKAKHLDYVIAEAHRNYIDENDCGTVSLIIFQICKDWKSDKNPKPLKFNPILKFYHKFTVDEANEIGMKLNPITSSNYKFMKILFSEIQKKKLEFLEDAISAAVDKSSERETSYFWYTSSKLADFEISSILPKAK